VLKVILQIMNKILTLAFCAIMVLTPVVTHACEGTGLLGFFQNLETFYPTVAFFVFLISAVIFQILKKKKYSKILFICTFVIFIVIFLSLLSETVGCSVGY